MNKKDLVEEIYAKVGFPKQETSAIVDRALDLMKEALAAGDSVLISNFGTLFVRQKEARRGRNPRTGETITLAERKVVKFKVSRGLKEQINNAHRDRDTGQKVLQDR